MLKCTINGKQVEVEPGSTVIQAFMKAGEEIAHYCWHPGLSVAGVCRMCMCDIEGNPRMQIACNTPVTEGMVVSNNSDKVKDAVKWTLEFHLINHPLDCPICDQAGECGLQEYYMKHGQYQPAMGQPKVKKRKVVDLGERVVLDTERCILCSRCVRFTDEVSKTNELGIFNRGDHAEVGTFEDKPLNNNYSLNTVDICPVGALTSKDFRFKQRVWFLKDFETVCTGCSTGCNVRVYHNENGLYRVKPVQNDKVNGFWMCDTGREMYKFANREVRLVKAAKNLKSGSQEMIPGAAAVEAGIALKKLSGAQIALVLTGQYTSEEYEAAVNAFSKDLGTKNIYHWQNNPESVNDFDGLLYRGDKNPNTAGLKQVLQKAGISSSWKDLESKIQSGEIKAVVVAGPENTSVYADMKEKMDLFSKVETSIWLSAARHEQVERATYRIPMKASVEKNGTFVNHAGLAQKIKRGTTIVSEALTLAEAADLISGKPLNFSTSAATAAL